MHVLRFGNKLDEEVCCGFIFANLFNSLYLLVRLWWNILVANLATNFQDLVTKVKNLVTLAPVLGAISRPGAAVRLKWSACILDPNLSTISLTWITSFAFVFMFNLYQNRVQLWGWCTIYVISPKVMSSLHHCPVNLYHLLLRLKWGKSNLNLLIKWNFHWLSSILGTYWDHFCSDA